MQYFYESDDRLYFVMPMIQGGELKSLIKRKGGQLPEKSIRLMAVQILVALDYLYKNYVLHRDIKSDNILLDEEGHV